MYPSWRYHPRKAAFIATSAEHEQVVTKGDTKWAHTPYDERHIVGSSFGGQQPEEEPELVEVEIDEAKVDEEAKPVRAQFASAKEFKAALKIWENAQ